MAPDERWMLAMEHRVTRLEIMGYLTAAGVAYLIFGAHTVAAFAGVLP